MTPSQASPIAFTHGDISTTTPSRCMVLDSLFSFYERDRGISVSHLGLPRYLIVAMACVNFNTPSII